MSNETRWQAVLDRDATSDGQFVYGVASTHIYCKPSCPSRRPNRENVKFFDETGAAEKAGFRACRRCQPDKVNPTKELIESICRYIEVHSAESPGLTELGKTFQLNPQHLQRTFKAALGITPHEYLEAYRLNQLKQRLKDGDEVTGAMYEVGYSSSSRLYEQAPTKLGMTPATYRQGGKGMTIKYDMVNCPLGLMLVAATERGLCAVSLGDSETNLLAALRQEYPQAQLERDETSLRKWSNELVEHMKGRPLNTELPLAVSYTPFQGRVWQALQDIPYGTTRSYGDIARTLGQPTAVRAVAQACASNKIALVIPCHRVIRENGALGGYRWGLERKEALITGEKMLETRN